MNATQTPTIVPSPADSTEFVRAWRVTSRRHPHITYTVTYDRLRNEHACQCPGFFYRGGCWHIDQAIAAQVAEWRRAKRGAA